MYIVDSGGYIYIQIKEDWGIIASASLACLVFSYSRPDAFYDMDFPDGDFKFSTNFIVTGEKPILLLVHTYMDASPAFIGEIKFEIFRTTIPEKSKKNAENAKRQKYFKFPARAA